VEEPARSALIRSLQRFQVGESGDGAHLKRCAERTHEPAYAEAIALFVAEEQAHARLLAEVLHELDAPLLTWHWSDALFLVIRRAAGLHHELLVLLIAELIALRYYAAVRDAARDEVVGAVCAQILRDEEWHVAFHFERLNEDLGRLAPPVRWALRNGWRLLCRGFALGVAADHRGLFRAAGLPLREFYRDCCRNFDDAAARIFKPAPVPATREEAVECAP
jgi:hypothetical protein